MKVPKKVELKPKNAALLNLAPEESKKPAAAQASKAVANAGPR